MEDARLSTGQGRPVDRPRSAASSAGNRAMFARRRLRAAFLLVTFLWPRKEKSLAGGRESPHQCGGIVAEGDSILNLLCLHHVHDMQRRPCIEPRVRRREPEGRRSPHAGNAYPADRASRISPTRATWFFPPCLRKILFQGINKSVPVFSRFFHFRSAVRSINSAETRSASVTGKKQWAPALHCDDRRPFCCQFTFPICRISPGFAKDAQPRLRLLSTGLDLYRLSHNAVHPSRRL